MIEDIKASVTFTTPIKSWSFSGQFSPPPGITAVVGRNGSGKSLLAIETPRYLLFGKRALRGAAADYSAYDAEGIFTIQGRRYAITRSPRREQLLDLQTGVIEAVGADGVTKKVIEILGYDLDVFDLANAAVQKQTDKLGKLRASERKQAIDKVVGLASYETIEKACRQQATLLKAQGEGLISALRAPVVPDKPEDYMASQVLEATIKRERKARSEYDALERATVHSVTAPREPHGARIAPEIVDAYAEEHAQAKAMVQRREHLMAAIARMPESVMTEEAIFAAEERYLWEQDLAARGPKPTVAIELIKAAKDTWAEIAVLRRKQDEEVSCPKCGHRFHTLSMTPQEPGYSLAELGSQEDAHRKWAEPLRPEPTAKFGSLSGPDARRERSLIAVFESGCEAQALLDESPEPAALPDLAEARRRLAEWQRYDAQLEAFNDALRKVRAARAELDQWLSENDVPLTADEIDALQRQLTRAQLYEAAQARHLADQLEFESKTKDAAELTRRAEAYREGSKNLAGARAEFKAHLAPSLSRIATNLIFKMSAGVLTSVVVDEDMEITVDGQKIETLSGAGETVANLALRIALGQALVGDTFPVFLGDEIDSDADEERREATKLALLGLKDQLSQIILVTHRAVDIADLVVDLDNL